MNTDAKIKELPLVSLEGKDENAIIEIVSSGVKRCFERLEMRLVEEFRGGKNFHMGYAHECEGEEIGVIIASYLTEVSYISLQIKFGLVLPHTIPMVKEMANLVNLSYTSSYAAIDPDSGELTVTTGMYLTSCFDTQHFYRIAENMLAVAATYLVLLTDAYFSEDKPRDILRNLADEVKGATLKDRQLH